jgi:hypothetical protein
MEPEQFKIRPSEREQSLYKDAELYGYQEMDRLVGKFLQLIDDNTVLIFATALSQQACLAYEDDGGKTSYQPRDFAHFAQLAGLTGHYEISPVMSEQFHVFFPTESAAAVAHDRLASMRVNDRPVLQLEQRGKEVFAGCCMFDEVPRDAVLTLEANGRQTPFFDIFYHVEGIKSGMHHLDGIFWVSHPERTHHVHGQKMPLTNVAALILDLMGLPKASHMHGSTTAPGASRTARGPQVRPEMAEA